MTEKDVPERLCFIRVIPDEGVERKQTSTSTPLFFGEYVSNARALGLTNSPYANEFHLPDFAGEIRGGRSEYAAQSDHHTSILWRKSYVAVLIVPS